jgi:hypothetical protein
MYPSRRDKQGVIDRVFLAVFRCVDDSGDDVVERRFLRLT